MPDQSLIKKIQTLKLLILDVDGVLTNGQFFLGPDGQEYKAFHAQDGFGLKAIQKAGINIAIISGRTSIAVSRRAEELGIQHVFQGIKNKTTILNQLIEQMNISLSECAYIGDDVPDLTVMQMVGVACTVANATPSIQAISDFQAKRCGGDGAVREICDWLLLHHQVPHNQENPIT